jgi:TolB protein
MKTVNLKNLRTDEIFAWARLVVAALILAAFALCGASPAHAQDWFKTGTGLGVAKARVAVPEFGATAQPAQPLEQTFHTVLWNDLQYSGALELVSPSFYPTSVPTDPSQIRTTDWSNAPANTYMLAFGSLDAQGSSLAVSGYLDAVNAPSPISALQKIYRGNATDADARKLAHQFADDIIARLSGGVPGIATTKIAFVSNRSGTKEIWEMDYDGSNQHQVTHLKSISLTPRWSPDANRIAFTCYVPYRGIVTPEICLYSMDSDHLISFPKLRGTNSSPAWSPDGAKLAFMSSSQGDPGIFVANSDGTHIQQISLSRGVSTSPVWNPKTGQQIIFVSDRGGEPVLYQMNADGSNVERINMPDMGYVVDPAWSPNGQLLAFAWRRPSGNFDIYIMDIVSHQLVELTRDSGRNERPSWAPDGRHIVFESTRTGTRQIWTVLADGSMAKQLTFQGHNESANWSPK